MLRKSYSEVYRRTLDYLAKKHPWFGVILRNRWLALSALACYVGVLLFLVWQIHSGEEGGWKEIVKSYSPLMFDLLVIFVCSVIFLVARGYYIEEESRIDGAQTPAPDFFLRLPPGEIRFSIRADYFFSRHPAVAAMLDALPLDQDDFFLAHAGSLDIPKLTLRSIETNANEIALELGVGSFREFFFTHHFADYVLSRSSSGESGKKETLRNSFSPLYERAYAGFFKGEARRLDFLAYTPNTLGITGCVQVVCGAKSILVFQRRGHHESAARDRLQLAYAGTLEAYPRFVPPEPELELKMLAGCEFEDEFMQDEPGRLLEKYTYTIRHTLVGICANSQYLFQPELFVLTTLAAQEEAPLAQMLEKFAPGHSGKYWAVTSFAQLRGCLAASALKLRPLCAIAIERIYAPLLESALPQAQSGCTDGDRNQ
jgi:hypothetical protein